MYLYNLYGYEESTVLTNDKEISKEEFDKLCMSVPKQDIFGWESSDMYEISEYLIKVHGFKRAVFQASFFTDDWEDRKQTLD